MIKDKVDLFIENSSSFHEDGKISDLDNKHKDVLERAYKQFSLGLNFENLKNWSGQSDMTVPAQFSWLQFKHRGIKAFPIFLFKLIFRLRSNQFIKSSLLDDISIIEREEGGCELLAENPVHLTPGSNLFYQYKNTTVNARWLRYLYILQRIKSYNLLGGKKVWIDVGSYYGGLAGLVKKYFPETKIILVDFHHQLCRSYVYLSELYPEVKHIFPDQISDYPKLNEIPDGSIAYVPVSLYKDIQSTKVDLFTNSFSFGEMRREMFDSYLSSNLYQNANFIYLINRFVSAPFFEPTYDSDLNILDYALEDKRLVYFDIFPMHFYMLIRRKVLGGKEFRNVSSPYFEAIINQERNYEQ